MSTPIASLSIAARATLNMHSLNNEGGESNQIHTRMVEIVDHEGELQSVNAISGDMLKHVLMEHFHHLSRDRGVSLCVQKDETCQQEKSAHRKGALHDNDLTIPDRKINLHRFVR